jgi:hypothetical protein
MNSWKSRDLPTPGLADDRDDLAAARLGLLGRVTNLLKLGLASDEPCEPTRLRRLQTGSHRRGPDELEDLHSLRDALDRHRAERPDLDEAFGQAQRLRRQPDRPRERKLLHPGGEVRRLADRRVIHSQVAADGANEDVTGVEPGAHLHLDALRAPELLRIPPDGVLHAQRRVTRAHRVVLVGQRRAEQRHDAVAHHLVHRALVPMNGLHHPLEDGIEDLARVLGVPLGEQLHGALEVGEEYGDLLALAFERRPRREDPLGEMLGRVHLSARGARARAAVVGDQARAAAVAEAAAGGIRLTARRTAGGLTRTTAVAEARRGGIVLTTLRAGHRRAA